MDWYDFIDWLNSWFRDVLSNISDVDYINLYKDWIKIDVDFSDVDNYWYRHNNYITVELIKENSEQLKYKLCLMYNDSDVKYCYIDFEKIDLDFSIFVRKINNNIFNLLLDVYKDSLD